VIHGDFKTFYKREIKERELFRYPPFVRQIAVTIRHKNAELSREAAHMMALELRRVFGERILGPSVPSIARVRNQYIHLIHIKMEREGKIISQIKQAIKDFQNGIVKKKSMSTVRISVDVDSF
jgi:primosomal protein N' (replication factor Y)